MNKKNIKKKFEKPDMKQAKKRPKETVSLDKQKLELTLEQRKLGENKTYNITTFGCQMNIHDTEILAGILEMMGYIFEENVEKADLIIFNTCAIRENAETKVFSKIGEFKKLKKISPEKILAVCGCMSQEEVVVNKLLTSYPYVDLIFGTHNVHRVPVLLENLKYDQTRVVEVWSQDEEMVENLPKVRDSKTKAWVNIIYGCDKFCTYCIVPFTRGRERSRKIEDVLAEIKELADQGYKEVTLLGQNVNAYGKDLAEDYRMADLLEQAAKYDIPRLRFTTSHPWDFDDELVDVIAKYDNIMPHIHLPVQSGNNEVLKIMGRSYTKEQYLKLFDQIKQKVKNATITTDIIVGYPNETKEQFQETLDLFHYCQFSGAYTFVYSQRDGTPAAKMVDNIELSEKKSRLQELNKLVDLYSKKDNEKQIGTIQKVLVDGPSNKNKDILSGYTETLKLVHFEGDGSLAGEIVEVEIIEARKFNLMGNLVK